MILESYILQWIVLGLLVWLITLTILLTRSILHYNRLTKNITKKDLKTIISEILNQVNLNEKEISTLSTSLSQAQLKMKYHIQKIGFIRFNPFPQTGGDQSFCLSLLDENNTGFVLSSLHSRDATRFYGKTIKNGNSNDFKLSTEEKKAIKNAK